MSKANMAAPKRSAIDRVLDGIERVANKLPPPGILFCYLFIIVAVLGAIFSFTGITLANPATQEPVSAQNFFSTEGIQWLLGNLVKNFTGFAPLGLVITMTLAIGFCEESGMIMSMLRSGLKMFLPPSFPMSSPLSAPSATSLPIPRWSSFRQWRLSSTWASASIRSSV